MLASAPSQRMYMTNRYHSLRPAFTLVELLVAMVLASIMVSLTVSTYSLFRKAMAADQARADISQNGRIVLDRLSRELRQSADISTTLPTDQSDMSVTEPHEIEFLNGHSTDMTYRRYYLNSSTLELDSKEYYCQNEPTVRVLNSPASCSVSDPLTMHIISTTDVADHVQSISFYGDRSVTVMLTTTDGLTQTYTLESTIYRRN